MSALQKSTTLPEAACPGSTEMQSNYSNSTLVQSQISVRPHLAQAVILRMVFMGGRYDSLQLDGYYVDKTQGMRHSVKQLSDRQDFKI